MRCAYDVAVCVLYDHNVSFIYIERDTDPHAEVYRFDNFFFSVLLATSVIHSIGITPGDLFLFF
jgi:hypothetical protein